MGNELFEKKNENNENDDDEFFKNDSNKNILKIKN